MRNIIPASLLLAALIPAPALAQTAPPPGDPTEGAQELKGHFTLYRKNEKVWISLRPDQLDKPFFFTYNVPQSVGERGLYSSMGASMIASFHKTGSQVQLIAKNTRFIAEPGSPESKMVADGFSDSLLASAPALASKGNNTLVEANTLLFVDIPGYMTSLESVYRLPYSLDARNSSFSKINNSDDLTGLRVKMHYNLSKMPASASAVPSTPPDPRSLFVSFYYNFAKLPEQPMRPRHADDRIGYFVSTIKDFSNDLAPNNDVHLVKRWRLEKADPNAPLSEPKQPIVYWLDKNIPLKYRASVTAAVLEWNKAFEKIGFKNAIVVKQQNDNDDFDTLDARHASIRWYAGIDPGAAIGPSHMDPRSGEILDADIAMSDVFGKSARRLMSEERPSAHDHRHDHNGCNYAAELSGQFEFALDALEARGLGWNSAQAEALAQAYVKAVITHEVGHTLGLRHNFRSSVIYTLKQLEDPAFTRVHGLAGSVMDYIPFNLALQGEKQGEYVMSTLGPYDYLAIEYGYKPIDPLKESSELAKIAARTTSDPQLVFATDEDAGFAIFNGIDPEVSRFDLGADPLEYYKKRIKLTRELWDRTQKLQLREGESYERLTRSFNSGLGQLRTVTPLIAKYVGGVRYGRDHAGTAHAVFEPTSPARQREALQLITQTLFNPDSFRLDPAFVARLGRDRFQFHITPDTSVSNTILAIQRTTLDALLNDGIAQRLLDSREKVASAAQALSLGELYDTLQNAIWKELKTGQDTSITRRNLQREHLRRLSAVLLRGGGPADSRSLQRLNAEQLRDQLRKALAPSTAKTLSRETKAHYSESLNTLNDALKAPLNRVGI